MIKYRLRIDTDKNLNDILMTTKFKFKYFWNYEISENSFPSAINKIISFLMKKQKLLTKNKISNKDISVWVDYEYDEYCLLNFLSNDFKQLANLNIDLCINCWKKTESELLFPCDLSNNNETIFLKVNTTQDLNLILPENIFVKKDNSWYFEADKKTIRKSIAQIKSVILKYLKLFNKNGVKKDEISIVYYYEYVQQCGMEFSAKLLKQISKLDINFQVMCVEKKRCWY